MISWPYRSLFLILKTSSSGSADLPFDTVQNLNRRDKEYYKWEKTI